MHKLGQQNQRSADEICSAGVLHRDMCGSHILWNWELRAGPGNVWLILIGPRETDEIDQETSLNRKRKRFEVNTEGSGMITLSRSRVDFIGMRL